MMRRTWKGLLKMSVQERAYLNAEILRSRCGGSEQDGTIDIFEDRDRYTIKMDPCGSGGRMRSFYKKPELIPEESFTRLGFQKGVFSPA